MSNKIAPLIHVPINDRTEFFRAFHFVLESGIDTSIVVHLWFSNVSIYIELKEIDVQASISSRLCGVHCQFEQLLFSNEFRFGVFFFDFPVVKPSRRVSFDELNTVHSITEHGPPGLVKRLRTIWVQFARAQGKAALALGSDRCVVENECYK